jgi:hypothetical protein
MNRKQMIAVVESVIHTHLNDTFDFLTSPIVDAVIAAQGDGAAKFRVHRDAPDTSKAIVDKIRSGSLQAEMLQAFINKSAVFGGATDDEMERFLGRSHQSASGCRNTLVRKGYLVDSGERRMNSHGNMAIVWYYTGKEVAS